MPSRLFLVYRFPSLPRDAMQKSGLCCRAVARWVSVTFVYCVETVKDAAILKFIWKTQ